MEVILNFLNKYSAILLIVIFISLIILLYQFIQVNKKLSIQKKRYDMLLRGRVDFNLEELIKAHSNDIFEITKSIEELKKEVNISKSKSSFSIQKIGFVKYNAFFDLKNKLSYSLALLDSFNNGILFTTIYGRESCITYAKEVKSGDVNQELSKEEMEALKKAIEG